MNSRSPHDDYADLAERVTRLELQIVELKGIINAAVAELKGMIEATNARVDGVLARLDEHDRRFDSLEASMRKLHSTLAFGGISAIITILLGVGGINASMLSGMTQAFQVGGDGGAARSELRRDINEHAKRIAAIEAQTTEIRKIADDIRRTNEEMRKSNEEMRKSNEEMRKSNDAFKQEVRAENAQTRREVQELKALIERRLPPDPRP
jgi:predicted RNase H-like nuclease (RuvC/YqgF family)